MIQAPWAYSTADRALEEAEDEMDCVLGAIYRAIEECNRQGKAANLSDHGISDAKAALMDAAANLKAARDNLNVYA